MAKPLRIMAWNLQGAHFQEEAPHRATADFHPGLNPNGVWRHGYSVSGGSARELILFDRATEDRNPGSEDQMWTRSDFNVNGTPAIWRNLGTTTRYGVAPGQLSLHPGPRPDGDVAILRFTAPPPPIFHDPAMGPSYRIHGRFLAGDSGGMSGTIVSRTQGDVDTVLQHFETTADDSAFDLTVNLAAGETVDFIVGNNGDHSCGNTPIEVTVDCVGQMEKLQAIASRIRDADPDVVLLNEVCVWNAWHNGGLNQAAWLAAHTGLAHVHCVPTTALGVGGFMSVGVLSRHPLGPVTRRPVMRGRDETKYAMLDTTVVVDGQAHRLLSLRFDAWDAVDNEAGHRQLMALVQDIESSVPVIVGGDFNAGFDTPWFLEFVERSGLTPVQRAPGVDHIFYRGPCRVAQAEVRPVPIDASDHPFVITELAPLEAAPFLDDSILTTSDAADEISVDVVHGALGPDEVEFVLDAGPAVDWRKEIVIAEGAGAGTGRWTLFTNGPKKSDRNGLYLYQLPGATLEFRKAKAFGRMRRVLVSNIDQLKGGTRVTFRWSKD